MRRSRSPDGRRWIKRMQSSEHIALYNALVDIRAIVKWMVKRVEENPDAPVESIDLEIVARKIRALIKPLEEENIQFLGAPMSVNRSDAVRHILRALLNQLDDLIDSNLETANAYSIKRARDMANALITIMHDFMVGADPADIEAMRLDPASRFSTVAIGPYGRALISAMAVHTRFLAPIYLSLPDFVSFYSVADVQQSAYFLDVANDNKSVCVSTERMDDDNTYIFEARTITPDGQIRTIKQYVDPNPGLYKDGKQKKAQVMHGTGRTWQLADGTYVVERRFKTTGRDKTAPELANYNKIHGTAYHWMFYNQDRDNTVLSEIDLYNLPGGGHLFGTQNIWQRYGFFENEDMHSNDIGSNAVIAPAVAANGLLIVVVLEQDWTPENGYNDYTITAYEIDVKRPGPAPRKILFEARSLKSIQKRSNDPRRMARPGISVACRHGGGYYIALKIPEAEMTQPSAHFYIYKTGSDVLSGEFVARIKVSGQYNSLNSSPNIVEKESRFVDGVIDSNGRLLVHVHTGWLLGDPALFVDTNFLYLHNPENYSVANNLPVSRTSGNLRAITIGPNGMVYALYEDMVVRIH